jgi:coenzyme PQQ precursor peptide PqqA
METREIELWVTPDFDDLSVCMEATAYSGGGDETETIYR